MKLVDFRHLFSTRRKSNSESGAFIVLAAMVLAVLFAFIAIAIDSARTLTTMSEKLATADAVALASLDAYLNREPALPATQQQRHDFKWAQVQNEVVKYYNSNQSTFTEDQTITSANINAANTGIKVQPGRWWINRPATCGVGDTGCPCAEIVAPLNRPCFQSCSITAGCSNVGGGAGDIFATAMSVTLNTEGQGGVKTVFAKIVGIDKIEVEGKAYSATSGSVAAMLPHVGVLLFDLSRGMTMDSYLPFERAQFTSPGVAEKQEYSFPVNAGPCSAAGTASAGGAGWVVPNAGDFGPYRTEYNTNYTAADKDEYKCYSGTLGGNPEKHIVATSSPLIPEPYDSMRRALNLYLTEFKTQGRAGDKLMLLGFDNVDNPEWHFPQANASGPVFLDPNDPQVDQLITMTSSNDEAAKKLFIPRAASKLDLTRALRTAADQIIAAFPSTKIEPYVMLFSNGFSLCGNSNPPAPTVFAGYSCAELTQPPSSAATLLAYTVTGPLANLKNAVDQMNKQILSLDEALVVAGESYLKPNGIKVHVVAGNTSSVNGSQIPAHSALLGKEAGGGCADDWEIRKWRYLNVLPYPDDAAPPVLPVNRMKMISEFINIGRAPASPAVNGSLTPNPTALNVNYHNRVGYNQPSKYLYSLAATTLGNYLPLRAECATTTIGAVNGYCSPPARRLGGTPPDTASRITATRAKAYRPAAMPVATTSDEIDKDGRMLCTPRDGAKSKPFLPGGQMSLYTDNIIQTRSVVLVMPD